MDQLTSKPSREPSQEELATLATVRAAVDGCSFGPQAVVKLAWAGDGWKVVVEKQRKDDV